MLRHYIFHKHFPPRHDNALKPKEGWRVEPPLFSQTSGGGLHEMGKDSVRAAMASERYLSDVEVKLHNMYMHDQVFITNNDEHVEEIAMKQ